MEKSNYFLVSDIYTFFLFLPGSTRIRVGVIGNPTTKFDPGNSTILFRIVVWIVRKYKEIIRSLSEVAVVQSGRFGYLGLRDTFFGRTPRWV